MKPVKPETLQPASYGLPTLTCAQAGLIQATWVMDQFGQMRSIQIPNERPLTLYIDREETVTLMTLGAAPELLALGFIRNQKIASSANAIASITVDWDVASVAVKTRPNKVVKSLKDAKRTVTTGCGQGSMYGDLMDQIELIQLPNSQEARVSQQTIYDIVDAMRKQDSVHREAGSVHGCALFQGSTFLVGFEDVGRHNAVDTIAGWMWMHGPDANGMSGADKIFYSTGRLTSEMVMKAAQMGIPVIVSRNGVTQMGLDLANQLGMTLFGRAGNRHFLCYSGFDRFDGEAQVIDTNQRIHSLEN